MPNQLAKIIADSVSPAGVRLTTMEIVIPRIVLAEFNTHRVFSRNSASSRAIPIQKMLKRVKDDPYIPDRWGKNGKGMQDHGALNEVKQAAARRTWLDARQRAIDAVQALLAIGVHKQTTNRLLEPFMWHTVIVSATEWSNFFHLRDNEHAHPAIQRTAAAMVACMETSEPGPVADGDWHLPYVDERDDELLIGDKVKVSCARCARVSYLTHDGKRAPAKDVELYDRLLTSGHMSPFEHAATPLTGAAGAGAVMGLIGYYERGRYDRCFTGNFRGWYQHRKQLFGEHDMLAETVSERAESNRCSVVYKQPHPATQT